MIGTIAVCNLLSRNSTLQPEETTEMSFLSLPLEIRMQVYEMALLPSCRITSATGATGAHRIADNGRPQAPHAYASVSCRPDTSLLLANKQIKQEYMRTLTEKVELTVVANATWDLSNFVQWLKPSFSARILRSIRSCTLVSDWPEFVRNSKCDDGPSPWVYRSVFKADERLQAFVKILTVQQRLMVSMLWGLRSFLFTIDCGFYPGTNRSGRADEAVTALPDYNLLYSLHDRLLHGIQTSAVVEMQTPLRFQIDTWDDILGTPSMEGYTKNLGIPVARWQLTRCTDTDAWCGTFPEFCGLQGPEDVTMATGEGDWRWKGIF
ncbi:hypothetical protein LTR36_003016 [Oleoguttula mirabilis]|uniref:Uncharacterized protein n=1 Tax=Oleoguttula mirabilis TaxID=1507867 RepID=A0AAV9JWN3_9PEZI|nr:hypothetical protein LTR36_003016 [Oleoguttula mirabilis]